MRPQLRLLTVGMLLFLASPASASDGLIDVDPGLATYGVTSLLTPIHLGNYVIGEASGTSFGDDPGVSCWSRFEEFLYADQPEEWEPDELAIEVAMLLLPDECKSAPAVRLTAPVVLEDNCDPGSIFAVRGTREWVPGDPFAPPGEFVFSGVTGSVVVDEVVFNTCLEVFDPDDDIADVAAAVPAPGFGKSPEIVGLTGLDTWLWHDFSDPASHYLEVDTVVTTIRGLPLTIEARAWVDEVRWDMDGDGEWDVGVDIPEPVWHEPPSHEVYLDAGGSNSEADAAAMFLYETKGEYVVSVGVVWHGVYTVTVPDFGGIYRYPAVTRVETFPYRVCEIRGVLTQPGEHPDLETCPVP